jgi:hypothetical protein
MVLSIDADMMSTELWLNITELTKCSYAIIAACLPYFDSFVV